MRTIAPDMVATGGFDIVALPASIQITGFRIIPVLASGASWGSLASAYATLEARMTKQSFPNFIAGVVEDIFVPGPDWIRSPGLGALSFRGVVGVTYRIWIATDCKEMKDAVWPVMNGFAPGGTVGGSGTVTTTATTENLTGTAPTLGSDGVDITAARSIKVSIKAANALATLNAAGSLKAYGYSTGGTRWVRIPELDYVPTEATVEPLAIGPAPFTIFFGVGRVAWVPNALTVSAGTQVVKTIEVLT